MDVSEKWGTDVDTAVELALAELKATKEEVEITVLEQPSRGFFGIGSKLALVRVERKKEDNKKANLEVEKIEAEAVSQESSEIKKEIVEKKEEKPVEKAHSKLDRKSEEYTEVVTEHKALSFLSDVTEKMGLNLAISAKSNGKDIYVSLDGKDSGTIIGKRGQTLDAIQYLTSLVVNKGEEDYVRVVVDSEHYRSKREKTLENLAKRLADKVVKTHRSVKLEPMNPYERKVIHSILQDDQRVTTRSEGQDPYRRVIIELK